MPAIHSVFNHSDNTLSNHHQQDSQTYSELLPEIDNAPLNSEYDFDFDLDENHILSVNSKYYDIPTFVRHNST